MISIIMPTYNRAYIIERAIESVFRQTYVDWELIIVDDCSSDNTEQVVSKYIGSKVKYYINEKNMGANVSRNRGAEYAEGEFLAFLDSDNYWPENRLELQIQTWERHKEERCFFYGKVQIDDGETVEIVPSEELSLEELKQQELNRNVIDTNTIFICKKLFKEVGGFDESIPRLQDWELVLRMLFEKNINAIYCQEILSFNEIQENSISKDYNKLLCASGKLFERYFCKFQSDAIVLERLFWLVYSNGGTIGLEENLYRISTNRNYLQEALKQMYIRVSGLDVHVSELEERYQAKESLHKKSLRMERLLYNWHKKNLLCKEKTMFLQLFDKMQVRSVSLYGLGKLGQLVYDEIKELPVEIVCGIDEKVEKFNELSIIKPQDNLPEADLIIVALIQDDELVKKELESRCKIPILTLYEIAEI